MDVCFCQFFTAGELRRWQIDILIIEVITSENARIDAEGPDQRAVLTVVSQERREDDAVISSHKMESRNHQVRTINCVKCLNFGWEGEEIVFTFC